MMRVVVYALLGWLATSAPVRAQCPDAGRLERLRDTPSSEELMRLVRARPGRLTAYDREEGYQSAFVEVTVHRLWPDAPGRCASAILRVRQMRRHEIWGPEEVSVRYVEIDVQPTRLALRVVRRDVPAADTRVTADPALPDLDGDGVPEHFVWAPGVHRRFCLDDYTTRAGSLSCTECFVPGVQTLALVGSTGRTLIGPFPAVGVSGSDQDLARIDRRLHDHAADHPGGGSCPAAVEWSHVERAGEPTAARDQRGPYIELPVAIQSCRGWNASESSRTAACTTDRRAVRIYRQLDQRVDLTERAP